MKRRNFIKLTGAGATALSLKPPYEFIEHRSSIYSFPQMVGEVTQSSAILQTRLTSMNTMPENGFDSAEELLSYDIQGVRGFAKFELANNPKFKNAKASPWLEAIPDRDFIVKYKVDGLNADTPYFMRVRFGATPSKTQKGPVSQFSTLQTTDSEKPVSFVATSCLNLGKFFLGGGLLRAGSRSKAAEGEDRSLGFPALEEMSKLNPSFWVQTGDTVYYDYPNKEGIAKTRPELRAKWHRQMAMPRMYRFLGQTPVYLMKDDHEYRYNDSDNVENGKEPSPSLARATFLEQAPIAVFEDENAVTYRTRPINKHLQIWMPEGRDYRDANDKPDGPHKSIWGKEQLAWIKETLLASTATFKLFIVASPLVGPDDGTKHDNHVSYGGFQYERDAFFHWLKQHHLDSNFYIITGDRHWQYHSIHPAGFEEFGTGTVNGQNSRPGRKPGDPGSTDPLGFIRQPYIQEDPIGGFLHVKVSPPENGKTAQLTIETIAEDGSLLNTAVKHAK
ncbi:alkaline phosphatase D family protein [Zobellia galactanivorans]|uniref:alkaline phosphatase D family protein n=1 Tax=Zobellia galactanivorans (strain DSM 12802 / CCUG 47099 / CIP 106680 / NCIMB 13871 / Dsij) TaxID=63186 RepID=UPI001C072052|nr:alkaline phosphatase D family protein [Zobellia galactanivorans]MBU3024195.1 alkaline phosphatase D family protein [Zobellia galactanivorans]